MNTYPYRTYAEINLNKLEDNLRQVRKFVGDKCKIMFVLKGDAYGHGTPVCAKFSERLVDGFAVATIEEALSVRCVSSEKTVLLLGALQNDSDVIAAADKKITISAYSLDYMHRVNQILSNTHETIDCHIKIDTGMNRTGLFARLENFAEAVEQAERIYFLPQVRVAGIYTHFSCADNLDPDDVRFSQGQYSTFNSVLKALEKKGYNLGIRHCVSTGPLLRHPDWKMDMVRIGMLGYGQSIDEAHAAEMGISPIIRWHSKVVSILNLDPGESVSYGRIYRTAGREKIGVISVGFADGYNRSYSNRAQIIVNGKRVRQCGKVCMDFTMVNITGIDDVKVGDDVILLGGSESGLCITPDSLSSITEYGVNGWTTCQISSRVPRVYVYNNEVVEMRVLFH